MKTCGRSGIVAECMLVPKENWRRYCTKGNFSLSLHSITIWSCLRDDVYESSRWCDGIIAMEWRGGTVGQGKRIIKTS